MAQETNFELFGEILASDKLGAYQNWSNSIINTLGDDPSVLWEQLKWNPWAAMAIFEELEDKDATLFSCLEKRKDGVLSLPRYILPASDKRQDKKIAEFIEETLEDYFASSNTLDDADESPFESFLSEALDAVGDGVTIGEMIFAEARDRIFVKEVKFKPQHLFAFGDTALAAYSTALMAYPQTGRLHLRSGVIVEGYPTGGKLPEGKFFVFSYRPKKGNRWGSPLKRKVFWYSWIKRAAAKGWLRYIEKGSGTVVARYNDGAAEDEMQKAIGAATAVQEESAVAIPKKFLLEVHEMVRNIGSSHKELVDDYCNAEISRAIVGQTLTGRGSDGGGSRAMGEVHERVEGKKVEADAKALMAVINKRIIKPLVFMNFGPNAACPKWTLEYEQTEDLNTTAERISVLVKEVGLPLSKKHLYETFQMPEPLNEEDTLGGAAETEKAEKDELDAEEVSEFAEKKKTKMSGSRKSKSSLKTVRFQRLRPSSMKFSD
jgi:phage gp29-like protein